MLVGFQGRCSDRPNEVTVMWRKILLGVVLLAIAATYATAQDNCKDCDCYHPPVASKCEKCCHVTSGTIMSMDEHEFVLEVKNASGKPTQETFSLNADTKRSGDLRSGTNATVYFKEEGHHNLATVIEPTPKQKPKPQASQSQPPKA